MSVPDTIIIGHFNRAEALVWFIVALGLPFVVPSASRRQRLCVLAAGFGFVLFGVTDLPAAERTGAIPAWLWVSKIACGVSSSLAAFFTSAGKILGSTTGGCSSACSA